MVEVSYSKKVIIITGPTAIGKTTLSIDLAKKYNGEIIGADSIQVYKYFNIGSAKIKESEMDNVNHHLIDFLEPNEGFDVKTFQKKVNQLIEEIHSRNKLPIIVGGSTFYITALIENYNLTSIKRDPNFTAKLQSTPNNKLYEMLKKRDLESCKLINVNNRKRLIRALEISASGLQKSKIGKTDWKYKPLILLPTPSSKKNHLKKISLRVDEMISNGLLDEIKLLYKKYPNGKPFESIGYKEFIPWLKKEISLNEAILELKKNTNNYSKRQIRWIKNKIEGHIFYDLKSLIKINNLVEIYLKS